jgi:hypothetical protein
LVVERIVDGDDRQWKQAAEDACIKRPGGKSGAEGQSKSMN